MRHIIAIYMGLKNIIISYLYQGRKKEKKRNLPFLFLLGRVVLFIPLCLKHCFVKVSGLCAATFSFLFLFLDDSVLTTMQEGNSNLIKESRQCHLATRLLVLLLVFLFGNNNTNYRKWIIKKGNCYTISTFL